MQNQRWNVPRFFFFAILIFAGIVRLKGLSSGLPLHTLYGENDTFGIVLRMLQTGSLDPYSYIYPGLAYYVYLPFLYLFYLFGHIFHFFPTLNAVPDSSFIFVGRCVSALLGTATVYLVYRLARIYSEWIALFAMGILAANPQHIEFSHMLRPEIPAIFFVLLACNSLFALLENPKAILFRHFGLFAGAAFSIKYNIGLPLFFPLAAAYWIRRKDVPWIWPLLSALFFLIVFAITNPYLVSNPPAILYWIQRVDALYSPAEDYYGKNIFLYYLEFLTRYNYNWPLILAAGVGLVLTLFQNTRRGIVLLLYPLSVFLWLCSFDTRRTHGLLPLHPFLAIWAAVTLEQFWKITASISRSVVFKFGYALLTFVVLFLPFYRACVQTYLLGKIDNRSKAELWMTNNLPQGSKVALLQYQQVELDPSYFEIVSFSPREYVNQKKDFNWFQHHGFDYVVVSSGQYMRYFVEGKRAQRYRDYFLHLFEDGAQKGTLLLDLTTHPLLIPDYRVKVYATHGQHKAPAFVPAIQDVPSEASYPLPQSLAVLSLPPGYYSLELPRSNPEKYFVSVRNLKLSETILKTRSQPDHRAPDGYSYPFSIFAAKENSQFFLFSQSPPQSTPDQQVQFTWTNIPGGMELKRVLPALQVVSVKFQPMPKMDPEQPYMELQKQVIFHLKCSLANPTTTPISGYMESFLSEIGEPQPWRDYEVASGVQDFFLEGGQEITIDVPMYTENLTGDHQLSYWIFTRPRDLPYSPQYGGWFNKEIRVSDPRLGIHPIYGIPIP